MGQGNALSVRKTVSVTMLGGFSIRVDGNVLTDEINRSQKLWNVLCYLIAHRERNVPQTEFIEMFWSEENITARAAEPPSSAAILFSNTSCVEFVSLP